jgi:hypothetical protein
MVERDLAEWDREIEANFQRGAVREGAAVVDTVSDRGDPDAQGARRY